MQNILGTTENLELYNRGNILVYKFDKNPNGYSWESTYDSDENELTFKNSNGDSCEKTYDKNGNILTYKSLDGFSYESTYDENGNRLTHKDSKGLSWERTYDKNGKELTFKDSDGVSRGFDIPEFTMKQLVEKIGDFKLIK